MVLFLLITLWKGMLLLLEISRRRSGAAPGLGTYIPPLPPHGGRTFKLHCGVLMHTTDAKTKANYGW